MCRIRRAVDNVLLRFGRRAIWVDCAGAEDVTAGGAGVENFMRIISAMPDDTGIRLINFGHWVQYLT